MAIESFINKFGGWTESYKFYNGEVELRYDPKDHVYLLVTPDGLEKQDGVTTVVGIIDKSDPLMNWACKMMYQKLLRTIPVNEVEITEPDGTSVTRYIQPMTFDEFDQIANKAKAAHTERLEEAGAIGHVAHAWIEDYIKLLIERDKTGPAFTDIVCNKITQHLEKMPEDERAKNACEAALDWMKRHNVRWIGTERKIYSRKHKYAGTMDGLCTCDSCDDSLCCPVMFKDRLSVADWKTSNSLHLEYLYQTAAYMGAYNEEVAYNWAWGASDMELATDRWIIRLGKEDGEFDPWHCDATTTANDTQGFLDCLDLVRRVRNTQNRISERKADLRAALKAERDAVRKVKEALEKDKRVEDREKKQQARLEALKLACTYSKKYKGTRKPSCTTGEGGGPCVSCAFRYAKAQEGKPEKKKSNVGAFPHKEELCAATTNSCEITGQISTIQSEQLKTLRSYQELTPKPESLNSLMAVLVPKPQAIQLPSSSGPTCAGVESTTPQQSVVDDRKPYVIV